MPYFSRKTFFLKFFIFPRHLHQHAVDSVFPWGQMIQREPGFNPTLKDQPKITAALSPPPTLDILKIEIQADK